MSEYPNGWQKILSQGVHSFVIALGDERQHVAGLVFVTVVAGHLHQAFHELLASTWASRSG